MNSMTPEEAWSAAFRELKERLGEYHQHLVNEYGSRTHAVPLAVSVTLMEITYINNKYIDRW